MFHDKSSLHQKPSCIQSAYRAREVSWSFSSLSLVNIASPASTWCLLQPSLRERKLKEKTQFNLGSAVVFQSRGSSRKEDRGRTLSWICLIKTTSLDVTCGCSFCNWDRTPLDVAFLSSSPGSLHTYNLSVEISLPFPGDPEGQDVKFLQVGAFFLTAVHMCPTKNTHTLWPLTLKICILFWLHTLVFCMDFILVPWQSFDCSTSYNFK